MKKGENNIKIIIKNKITNLEYMFYDCISLNNIEGLKYLDISNGNNFSGMFYGCKSLSDIKPLENWNVSNGNNFSKMFFGCKSLSDIKPLENWNISNGINFSEIFNKGDSLSNIKPLENKVNIDKDNYQITNDTNGDKIDNKIKNPDNDNNNYIIINNNNNEKQEYIKPKYIFPTKGLNNLGSTSYTNSILQCLLHCSELVNYFLYEYKNDKTILKNKNKNLLISKID